MAVRAQVMAIRLLREKYRSRPRYAPYFAVLPPPPPAEDATGTQGPAPAGIQQAGAGAGPSSTQPTSRAATGETAARWQPSCAEELPQAALELLGGDDLVRAQRWRETSRPPLPGHAYCVYCHYSCMATASNIIIAALCLLPVWVWLCLQRPLRYLPAWLPAAPRPAPSAAVQQHRGCLPPQRPCLLQL